MRKFVIGLIFISVVFTGCQNMYDTDIPTETSTASESVKATPAVKKSVPVAAVPATSETVQDGTVSAEPQERETVEENTEAVQVDDRKIWKEFYMRLEAKVKQTYERNPWDKLARAAHINMESWMASAEACYRNPPKEDVIRKISAVLNVTYEYLMTGE